ncbi:MAG: UDP-N-acetylmuramyl-tripeptide synthetase [Candidatus Taylorbacteria bacterium]
MSFVGAVIYRFPSREINVVGVTGTKGKTSTAEVVNAILEEAGFKTALASTLRFKIDEESRRNMFKMTMPGRFFIQRFLRQAVKKKCTHAVIEITSEAQVQRRNRYIFLDALIFTNISPEHIESHGSYENYLNAKLEIAKSLENSRKPRTILVVNRDDKESAKFMAVEAKEKLAFSLTDAEPWKTSDDGGEFTFRGVPIKTKLPGKFNIYNILSASTYALSQKIEPSVIKKAVENLDQILGRVEKIRLDPKHPLFSRQDFSVVVDYAHTGDSLRQFYEVFGATRKICILGNTGGGRDTWKRGEMARIAEEHCDSIILTNEDPYDDGPMSIVNEMAKAITKKPLKIIIDRREAIREAISQARTGDFVLITGKGTDPFIMEANGKKTPWSDAKVAREELEKRLSQFKL